MNIEAIMKPLREFLSKMTKGQKIRLAVLGVVFIALVAIAVALLSRQTYVVLYSGLDAAEAGEIYNTLKNEKSVDAKLEGTTISVPEQERDAILVDMAASGYPKSGRTYDLYQSASGMSATDAFQNQMLVFQREEDLRSTIELMEGIDHTVVTLNIPKSSSMIKSQAKESSASVLVTVEQDELLTDSQVKTIRTLIARGSGVEEDNISISDAKGNYYSGENEGGAEMASSQLKMEQQVRQDLENSIKKLLDPIFLSENYEAAVNVELNWDDVLEQSVEFSPPEGSVDGGGIMASMRELSEKVRNGTTAEGNPGMDDNGGTVPSYQETDEDDDSSYIKTEREVNYELNEIKEEIKKAKGQISKLNVSININGNLDIDDYTNEVRTMVANAMGVEEEFVDVQQVPFYDNSAEIERQRQEREDEIKRIQTQALIRTIIIIVGMLGVVLLIVKLIRDISNNKLAAKRAEVEAMYRISDALPDKEAMTDAEGELDAMAVAALEKEKKSTERGQIEEFIDKSPEAVAQLLRNWISEETR